MKKIMFILLWIHSQAYSQTQLKDASDQINKSLPEIYDHATKLMRTTVENNNIFYHFILNATETEFSYALPKVKAQVLSTICSKPQERTILQKYNANIVYKYESTKGTSLGEFMVKPDFCPMR